MMKLIISSIFIITTGLFVINSMNKPDDKKNITNNNMKYEINKSEEEWKEQLDPEQYRVLRQKGTEAPYTGKYYLHDEDGIYKCAACGNELFYSDSKYESHCGWPSFYKPVTENSVKEQVDKSHGMVRTEILCGRCGSHLGHVFEDGPNPTGLRYCINSVSLKFNKDTSDTKSK